MILIFIWNSNSICSLKRWLNWPQWAKRSWWNVKSSFRNSSGTGQTSSSGQFLKLINMFTWIRSVSVNVSSFFSEEKMGALVHEFSLQSGWIVPVPVEGSGIRGSCGLFLRHSSWRPAWAHYIAVSDWSAPGLQPVRESDDGFHSVTQLTVTEILQESTHLRIRKTEKVKKWEKHLYIWRSSISNTSPEV